VWIFCFNFFLGKQEHPRGLLNHVLSQCLCYTRIPIILEMQPHWPGLKKTPAGAMISCVQRLVTESGEQHHVIADSAFAASNSIDNLTALNSFATISINNSTTSGLAPFYQFISQDLPVGQTRTYASDSTLVQVVQRGPHTSAIATSAFKLNEDTTALPPVEPKFSYALAIAMWENETAANICRKFNLPDTVSVGDIVEVVKAVTGEWRELETCFV